MFNIYLCDLFLFINNIDIANYADDTTPYICGKNTAEQVTTKLEIASSKVLRWFSENAMKANKNKCHLLTSTDVNTTICLGENIVQNSESQNLLGVIVDKNLTFNMHVSKLCGNASKKLYALASLLFHGFTETKIIELSWIYGNENY